MSKDENSGSIDDTIFYAYADNLIVTPMLTIEQLREFKGMKDLSEQEAKDTIEGLYKLSIITYKIYN